MAEIKGKLLSEKCGNIKSSFSLEELDNNWDLMAHNKDLKQFGFCKKVVCPVNGSQWNWFITSDIRVSHLFIK
jgi:hypothetical protein